MHREIEKFITDCKAKMKKLGWSYIDLSKACGMHKGSFPRIFGPQKRTPRTGTIRKLAQALGVEVPSLPESSRRTGGIGQHMFIDKPKVTLSEMEEKMKKSMICFKQGVALLEEIDANAERAIKEIAERMRGTSMLKKSLAVFRKH